jgi:hypothetical protein
MEMNDGLSRGVERREEVMASSWVSRVYGGIVGLQSKRIDFHLLLERSADFGKAQSIRDGK